MTLHWPEVFHRIFGQPFVKQFALCNRTIVCLVLSRLSVTLVYCDQTAGRIKSKLGMQVGLDSGHTVLDGDPGPPPQRGTVPSPNLQPISVITKWLNVSRCYFVER